MSIDTLDDVQLLHELDARPAEPGEHDLFAHYAKSVDILNAQVNGVAIEALCGKMWIPTRDPEKYPMCPTCIEIYACDRCMRNGGKPKCAAHQGPTL